MVLVTRQPPATFNGLANIYATLGSYYWLGFITFGLSPNKKRLALLGAQRQRSGTGYWRRAFVLGLMVVATEIISTRSG